MNVRFIERIKTITWYPESNLREDSLALYAPPKLFPVNGRDPIGELEAWRDILRGILEGLDSIFCTL